MLTLTRNGAVKLPTVKELTQELLLLLFDYDKNVGELVWKVSPNSKVPAGTIAGCVNPKDGYKYVGFSGKKVPVHRLVLLYTDGKWPLQQVDHVNRDRLDNRRKNLRDASPRENTLNRGRQENNTSGVTGVYWDADRGKWNAQIKNYGKTKHLGAFSSLESATQARREAERLRDELPKV